MGCKDLLNFTYLTVEFQNRHHTNHCAISPIGKRRSSSKSDTPGGSQLRLTNGANGEMTSTTATKNGSNGRANSIHMMTEGMKQDSNPDHQGNLPRVLKIQFYFFHFTVLNLNF